MISAPHPARLCSRWPAIWQSLPGYAIVANGSQDRPLIHIIRPLRKPAAGLLWAGLSLSALGDPLYAVALTWIAVGVLGSGAGDLAAWNAGVVLLATLGLGRWADGLDQRRSLVAADLVRAAALPAGTSSRRRPSRP